MSMEQAVRVITKELFKMLNKLPSPLDHRQPGDHGDVGAAFLTRQMASGASSIYLCTSVMNPDFSWSHAEFVADVARRHHAGDEEILALITTLECCYLPNHIMTDRVGGCSCTQLVNNLNVHGNIVVYEAAKDPHQRVASDDNDIPNFKQVLTTDASHIKDGKIWADRLIAVKENSNKFGDRVHVPVLDVDRIAFYEECRNIQEWNLPSKFCF